MLMRQRRSGVKHRCQPPVDERCCGPGLLHAASPIGSVWECECGKLWRVGRDILFGPAWFKAGWFTRRKYRQQHLITESDDYE